ncbi:aspartate carbamoyltransferase regulatory subunit [Porphyromonadaceae bacterium OttesenSCG-928-L07]|nr:aspartate carbamoyltransferase regulatory subunit [Porphyromonadaceae bacterium OttesenSCG-928-L07]MDL2252210.1 aspartate carbamoyltransferase regulatory subunit [Odoribacter sp. OttesenSCG-928-J03]
MVAKKELQVSAIENGTAIDHIPADKLFDVINVLSLENIESAMTFGTNLKSSIQGRKAIIKIWDKYLEDSEINKLALVAPDAKINIIKDYEVVEKKLVQVPEHVDAIVKCVNPKCITNYEYVKTKFTVVNKSPIILKCHYCEKMTDQQNIEVI